MIRDYICVRYCQICVRYKQVADRDGLGLSTNISDGVLGQVVGCRVIPPTLVLADQG